MAQPALLKGSKVVIMVGDGAAPEVFTAICGLTTKTFTEQVNTSDDFVQDCDDPDLIPVRRLNITGLQWDLSGDARYNRAQATLMRTLIGQRKNYRFEISDETGETVDAGYYEGPAVMTNRSITAPEGAEYVTSSIAIASDGQWEWTDA